ncbi:MULTISPECIES: TIR domain-containing protein [unclassified Moorena]|uniref:TIR domain-containing protein n=1 Tax=unclassified Moorena TaxID=2683338 RepID=UPI0013FF3F36|nr:MULTISPECIES: TIR domain-containing protein [unclassified Moorena]NEO15626.1 TIR domain-containing protein [Moorena sp. SIO3E8]NEQ01263.1 TIR domain-containing protein [Moorena sp. SIO3F7]
MTTFFDAFISYGRADSKAFATKLEARLTQLGLTVWFDQKDIPPAVDWQHQIDNGIERTHNFIFIISPHSVNSKYCLKEIELAIKYNKRIIPLVHVKSPRDKIPTIIRKLNWIYFQDKINDFEASFKQLMNSIRKHADYVEQHTRFLVKALEWDRNQQQTNHLLIQSERIQAESWLKVRFKKEQAPCVPTDLHCEFICESTNNANNLMTQVFISYSDKDQEIKDKIAKTMMREGITIWKLETDIKTGIDFQAAINQGIEEADNLIYLISTNSIQSKYCQQELEHAFEHNKRIIFILIEDTDIDQIPPKIRSLQFLDFTKYTNEANYRFMAAQLLKELNQDALYYEEHKLLLVKALKWLTQNRNSSILLRGHNLNYYENWLKVNRQRLEHPPLGLHEEFLAASRNQQHESYLDVFISYSRTDSDLARKLNEALQLQGKTTWFDQESIPPGSDFQEEIYRGIEQSDNFLFIISPASVNSPYCAGEVEYAQTLNKRFVTVLSTQVPATVLHPGLASIQWIDFNRHRGDFYPNFSELVRTLDTDREHVRSHTKWLQRAREWEQSNQDTDLLLRGSEFSIAQQWLLNAETNDKQPTAILLHKDYIAKSGDAISILTKREKRRLVILRLSLTLMSAAFAAAVGFGLVAFMQSKRAEMVSVGHINALSRYSLALRESHQEFDALIEAIRAARQLQKQRRSVKPETEALVRTALHGAVSWVREYNRLVGHNSWVTSVSFSPDGNLIASASKDHTVKLWSRKGKPLQTLKGHEATVWNVSFSPDGKTIATASQDKTVKLWSLDGKNLQTFKGHQRGVRSVSFSPDGRMLATASNDNTVKLWSLNGKQLQTLEGIAPGYGSISFSPDGKILASAGSNNTIKLWHLDGRSIATFKGHQAEVYSVSFSPQGKMIASASEDKTIKLWSLDGRELKTFPKKFPGVRSVRFSPDGKTLASASRYKTVKLWSLDGSELQTLRGHQAGAYDLSFSPDGKTLASAGEDKTIKLWRLDAKTPRTFKGHRSNVWSVSFSPDGKTLASASDDKTAKLWHLDYTCGKEGLGERSSSQIINFMDFCLTPKVLDSHRDAVFSVSFSPDGKTIATGSRDSRVRLWSKDGKKIQTLQGHQGGVFSVSFSPDSQTIVSGSWDKAVKLWSFKGRERQRLKKLRAGVRSVNFSPDGLMIAAGSDDNTIKLWRRGNLCHGELKPAKLKPANLKPAVGSDHNTNFLPFCLTPTILKGHDDVIWTVSFSPDSQMLVSGSEDETVKLWSRDGKEIRTLKGHKGKVFSVSFSPDGKMIASASGDKTVKLWNLKGQEIETLIGHNDGVFSLSFSPDGKMLASSDSSGNVIMWDMDISLDFNDLLGRACDWVGDYLKHNSAIDESDRTLCHGIKPKSK